MPWLTVLATQTECVSSRLLVACRYGVVVSVYEVKDVFGFIITLMLLNDAC